MQRCSSMSVPKAVNLSEKFGGWGKHCELLFTVASCNKPYLRAAFVDCAVHRVLCVVGRALFCRCEDVKRYVVSHKFKYI